MSLISLTLRNMSTKLRFLDAANTLQGKNLFFFYQAVAAGGGIMSSTTLPVNIEFWIDLQYEDA